MISCQQIVEMHWFRNQCHRLITKPAAIRDSEIKRVNWFNLVPTWVEDNELWWVKGKGSWREGQPWTTPLPCIAWTSEAVIRESANNTRDLTPIPDSPKSDDQDPAWTMDDEDYGELSTACVNELQVLSYVQVLKRVGWMTNYAIITAPCS